jgi:formamidopyrimidine-DNA glycosylase
VPELPEVEALARFLDTRTRGRTIVGVEVGTIAALKTFDPPLESLVGATIRGWSRRGKWLHLSTFTFDASTDAPDDAPGHARDPHLLIHLSRAGWLRWHDVAPKATVRPLGSSRGSVTALRMRLDDGSGFAVTEAGTQKRVALHVVRSLLDVPQVATLGPEPLDPTFTPDVLAELLAAKNQQVKGLLRDQSAIAGIGNAYSDEILHVARMSPYKLTGTLVHDEIVTLYNAIVDTLVAAIRTAEGKPAADLKDAKRAGMRVHGRTGQACPSCGDTIRSVSFADRTVEYCPTCQTGGRPLADRRLSRLLR